jgi:hypothetical protein
MMKDQMFKLYRKRVEVVAHGIVYAGVFLGADDETLYLIGPMSYLTIPMDAVTAVREEGASERDWLRKEIEGAPPKKPGETEEKRRYSKNALTQLYQVDAPDDWPEGGNNKGKK